METRASELDLSSVLRIARRYAPMVLICVLVTAAAAFVVSSLRPKQYTATAQVLFRSEQLDQQAAGLPVVNSTDPQAEADTNLKLATLPEVASRTATAMGPGFTLVAVTNSVSVSQDGDTKLASVAATSTSPETAARLANAYAQAIVVARQNSDAAYYASALRSVKLQLQQLTPSQQYGTQAAVLKDRQSSLETLAQLQAADVQVQQAATQPTAPSSPKLTRNAVLGGVLGLVLGVLLAFLLHRFDRRLREPKELEQIFGVPLIGVIPESQALKGSRNAEGVRKPLPHREAEIFGLLRAHIRYFNVDRELRMIVVVSAGPGEGKTTVARNLAVTSAMVGSRVLLVEADLRRPTVAEQLAVALKPGLAEALLDGGSLAGSVQHVELPAQGGDQAVLDVLVAGGVLPPNPPQVIESRSMRALLEQARQEYDLVVIDTPPLLLVPDAFPLLAGSDGVLVVSRLGRNGKDMATRLRDSLQGSDAPVLGVVANGVGRSHDSYGYDADYANRRADASDAEPDASDAEPDAPDARAESLDEEPRPLDAEPVPTAESNGHHADDLHDWIDFPDPVPAYSGQRTQRTQRRRRARPQRGPNARARRRVPPRQRRWRRTRPVSVRRRQEVDPAAWDGSSGRSRNQGQRRFTGNRADVRPPRTTLHDLVAGGDVVRIRDGRLPIASPIKQTPPTGWQRGRLGQRLSVQYGSRSRRGHPLGALAADQERRRVDGRAQVCHRSPAGRSMTVGCDDRAQPAAAQIFGRLADRAGSRREERVGVDLQQHSLFRQPLHTRRLALEFDRPRRMGQGDAKAAGTKRIEEPVEHRDITRGLDQQICPSLPVAREHEFLVGRLERPHDRDLRPGHDLGVDPHPSKSLSHGVAPIGDLADVNEGEIGAQVRCGCERHGAGCPRCADHFDCFFKGRRPIVDARKQVGVDVDELRHH